MTTQSSRKTIGRGVTRRFRRAFAGVVIAIAALCVPLTASAVPGGDPQATGCANSASTIWSRTYLGAGTVEVRYSSACGTNWVRVSGATGRPSEAGIWSAASGWQWSPSYYQSPSQYWTPMVYAPGSNCVVFRAKIVDVNSHLVDTGNLQLC
ncbi:DUF2690 domain-containing protein [Kribbella albertanoniae]|uniref:DUF2690 domain-containing protein n=1 Tax=Kribbella albertanoniae TaxID=1266829 RepID=A0A4R4PXX6_9ACTN|nr:DUF2690 domain-containing protein [Kribbella albertanoniae]